jgi:hypothetical protein
MQAVGTNFIEWHVVEVHAAVHRVEGEAKEKTDARHGARIQEAGANDTLGVPPGWGIPSYVLVIDIESGALGGLL